MTSTKTPSPPKLSSRPFEVAKKTENRFVTASGSAPFLFDKYHQSNTKSCNVLIKSSHTDRPSSAFITPGHGFSLKKNGFEFNGGDTNSDVNEKLKRLENSGLLQKLKRVQLVQPTKELMEEDEDDDDDDEVNRSTENDLAEQSNRQLRHSRSEPDIQKVKATLMAKSGKLVKNETTKSLSKSEILKKSSSNSSLPQENKFDFIKVKGKAYQILNTIGQGGSSYVYQVYHQKSQQTYAAKIVDLSKADAAVRQGYKNEIKLLLKLKDCNRVVRIIDYEEVPSKHRLVILMEKGDSDLQAVLKQFAECVPTYSLEPSLIKLYWKEMLQAVDEVHQLGIVHSDLKPVNFIVVSGKLKLIDFGIADAIENDETSVFRESQIGTVNYMAPECLRSRSDAGSKSVFKLNHKVDIWSLGCILYNLIYGKPPFGHLPNLIAKVQAILDPKFKINYPSYDDAFAVDSIRLCLQHDLMKRPSASELLHHPYVVGKPKANLITCQIDSLTPNRLNQLSKYLDQLSRPKKK